MYFLQYPYPPFLVGTHLAELGGDTVMKNSEANFINREKRGIDDVEDAGMCLLRHKNLHVHQNYIISSSDNLPNKV